MVDQASLVERRLLATARIGLLTVAVAMQFGFYGAFRLSAGTAIPAAEMPVYATLGVVAVGCAAGLLFRTRLLAPLRWVGVTVLLGCSAAMSSILTLDPVPRAENWSLGVIGWYGVALLFDVRLGWVAAFFGVHTTLLVWPVVASGAPLSQLSAMAITVVAVVVFQFGVALSALLVRALATAAERTAREEERLRISEEAAVATAGHRARRYADLRVTTLPLLAGFAAGELDPRDPTVRRLCAVEAARMRRLFGESEDVEDRLAHDLGAIIDVAERHGASVHLSVRGSPVEVPAPVRRDLLAPISEALVTAGSDARVTVLHSPDTVRVSIRCAAPELPVTRPDTVEFTESVSNGQLWMETAWRSR